MDIFGRYDIEERKDYFYGNLLTNICYNFIKIHTTFRDKNKDIKQLILMYSTDNINFLDNFLEDPS
jgi:hypothetical protein